MQTREIVLIFGVLVFISLRARICSEAMAPCLPVEDLDVRGENGFLCLHICRLRTLAYCMFTACS